MAGKIETKLQELGISLPEAAAPVANYVGWVKSGNQVFVSGQGPVEGGVFKFTGKLGKDHDIEAGQAAARLCAINVIAQVRAACGGDLDRVARVVKLGCFVSCSEHFTEQPKVANGASDLMVEVFGDAGRHARFAVGTNVLPLDMSVEVDAVFEVT